MINNNFTILGNAMKLNSINTSISTLADSISGFDNMAFCSKILEKSQDSGSEYGFYNNSLVYILPDEEDEESQNNASNVIVNLLMQMKATQNDQNNIINNKVMLREQIVGQLERELMFAGANISNTQKKQIKNIIINKTYNDKNFDNVVNSILKFQKKKVVQNKILHKQDLLKINNKFLINQKLISNGILNKYSQLNDSIYRPNPQNAINNKIIKRAELVNIETGADIDEINNYLSSNKNVNYNQANNELANDEIYNQLFKNQLNLINNKNSKYEAFNDKISNDIIINRILQVKDLVDINKISKYVNIKANEQIFNNKLIDNISNSLFINKGRNQIFNNKLIDNISSILFINEERNQIFGKKLIDSIYNNLSMTRLVKSANLVNIEKNTDNIIENYIKENTIKNVLKTFKNENKVIDQYKNIANESRLNTNFNKLINITNSNVNSLDFNTIIDSNNLLSTRNDVFNNLQYLINNQENIEDSQVQTIIKNLQAIKPKINPIDIQKYNLNIKNIVRDVLGADKFYYQNKNQINITKNNLSTAINKLEPLKLRLKPIDIEKYNLNVKNVVRDVFGADRIYHQDINQMFTEENRLNTIINKLQPLKLNLKPIDIEKYNLNVKNVVRDVFGADRIYHQDINQMLTEENHLNNIINKLQPLKLKLKPINTEKYKLNVKNVVHDLVGADKVYYNDAVEQFGQELVVLNDSEQVPQASIGPLESTQKFIYKEPIQIPTSNETDDFSKSKAVLESQVEGSEYSSSPVANNYNNINYTEEMDPSKRAVTREEAEKIIRECISDLNINTQSISREVMEEIERMIRTERRRFGMMS